MVDARNGAGWVRCVERRSLVVTTAHEFPVSAGEDYRFEVFGCKHLVEFHAALVTAGMPVLRKHDDLWFDVEASSSFPMELRLTSMPRYLDSTEAPRFLVNYLPAKVQVDGQQYVADVVDVARHGVALRTPLAIPRGAWVMMEIETVYGKVRAAGRVCYSNAPRDLTARRRVGVEIPQMSRLDGAKWTKLLESGAQGAECRRCQ